MSAVRSEDELLSLGMALLDDTSGLSSAEAGALQGLAAHSDTALVAATRAAIQAGLDPLGDYLTGIRPAAQRRPAGAVYTPGEIVTAMLDWAMKQRCPERVIDPGAGSGRFIIAAAMRFPEAALVAIEKDPVAAFILRANAAVLGISKRLSLMIEDYREAAVTTINGPTLFVGNPPYVRHHQISDAWKRWYSQTAETFGVRASQLAGLHFHFFLRTLQLAKPGDYGALITSAEWLDVNYGSTLRQLLADGMGGTALHVLDAKAMPFEKAITTGAITCFRVGERSAKLLVRSVDSVGGLGDLTEGRHVDWSEVEQSRRWSSMFSKKSAPRDGLIELGQLFRVHRGQVTGSNSVWIAGREAPTLPESVLFPAVTKARELIGAGYVLTDTSQLRKIVDIPVELESLPDEEQLLVAGFIEWAMSRGAHRSYVARHRRRWWSVGLRVPAPIICTYMARRPPVFVRNLAQAHHINVAHGLYPREELDNDLLDQLSMWLCHNVSVDSGRTYAGGLTKFEPGEVERILIPSPEDLPNWLNRPAGQKKSLQPTH